MGFAVPPESLTLTRPHPVLKHVARASSNRNDDVPNSTAWTCFFTVRTAVSRSNIAFRDRNVTLKELS